MLFQTLEQSNGAQVLVLEVDQRVLHVARHLGAEQQQDQREHRHERGHDNELEEQWLLKDGIAQERVGKQPERPGESQARSQVVSIAYHDFDGTSEVAWARTRTG